MFSTRTLKQTLEDALNSAITTAATAIGADLIHGNGLDAFGTNNEWAHIGLTALGTFLGVIVKAITASNGDADTDGGGS